MTYNLPGICKLISNKQTSLAGKEEENCYFLSVSEASGIVLDVILPLLPIRKSGLRKVKQVAPGRTAERRETRFQTLP